MMCTVKAKLRSLPPSLAVLYKFPASCYYRATEMSSDIRVVLTMYHVRYVKP